VGFSHRRSVLKTTIEDAARSAWVLALISSFSPRGARSRGAQQHDGRVAHNLEALNILGIDTGIPATRVLRARKTRFWCRQDRATVTERLVNLPLILLESFMASVSITYHGLP